MAVIDITHHILGIYPGNPDSWRTSRSKHKDIIKWLTDNVGEYYGHGEHPVQDIGSGWEITVTEELDIDGLAGYAIGWAVDITDEVKSTMFALVWA